MVTDKERNELFNNNKNLAHWIAYNHWGYNASTADDLDQEALFALWRCTEHYKEERAAFTTYATHCIKVALNIYCKREKLGCKANAPSVDKALKRVKEAEERKVPLQVVIDEHNDSNYIKNCALSLSQGAAMLSLSDDLTVQKEDGLTIEDIVADEFNLEEEVINQMQAEYIIDVIADVIEADIERMSEYKNANLSRKEQLAKYYMQWLVESNINQSEIAERLNVSRNTVHMQFKRWNKRIKLRLNNEVKEMIK